MKDDERLDLTDPVQREQQYRMYLDAFVIRARRVVKQSLLQDLDFMTKLAQGSFDLRIAADGTVEWNIKLPPEEQMECPCGPCPSRPPAGGVGTPRQGPQRGRSTCPRTS